MTSNVLEPGALELEIRALRERVEQLNEENRDVTSDYVEAAERSSRLAYLVAAGRQLNAARTRNQALDTIEDVVRNLVGCEDMAMLETDADGAQVVVRCTGPNATAWARHGADAQGNAGITACIPVRRGTRLVGAITLFSLVPQKSALDELDYELFELVAECAQRALGLALDLGS